MAQLHSPLCRMRLERAIDRSAKQDGFATVEMSFSFSFVRTSPNLQVLHKLPQVCVGSQTSLLPHKAAHYRLGLCVSTQNPDEPAWESSMPLLIAASPANPRALNKGAAAGPSRTGSHCGTVKHCCRSAGTSGGSQGRSCHVIRVSIKSEHPCTCETLPAEV